MSKKQHKHVSGVPEVVISLVMSLVPVLLAHAPSDRLPQPSGVTIVQYGDHSTATVVQGPRP